MEHLNLLMQKILK